MIGQSRSTANCAMPQPVARTAPSDYRSDYSTLCMQRAPVTRAVAARVGVEDTMSSSKTKITVSVDTRTESGGQLIELNITRSYVESRKEFLDRVAIILEMAEHCAGVKKS